MIKKVESKMLFGYIVFLLCVLFFMSGCSNEPVVYTRYEIVTDTLYVSEDTLYFTGNPLGVTCGAYWDADEYGAMGIKFWVKAMNRGLDTLYNPLVRGLLSENDRMDTIEAMDYSDLYYEWNMNRQIDEWIPDELGFASWFVYPPEQGTYYWMVEFEWDGF